MKVIVAVIHPDALASVQAALDEPGARVVSVSVAGEPGAKGVYRGVAFDALWPRFRVEIVVPNDAAAPYLLDAVVRAASLGGGPSVSGSVFMTDLDACVRVASADGERTPPGLTVGEGFARADASAPDGHGRGHEPAQAAFVGAAGGKRA